MVNIWEVEHIHLRTRKLKSCFLHAFSPFHIPFYFIKLQINLFKRARSTNDSLWCFRESWAKRKHHKEPCLKRHLRIYPSWLSHLSFIRSFEVRGRVKYVPKGLLSLSLFFQGDTSDSSDLSKKVYREQVSFVKPSFLSFYYWPFLWGS